MKYEQLELHLAPYPIKRAHAKRIKDCGGKYSACRSPYANKRFVTVPAREHELINELVRSYSHGPSLTMIARGGFGGETYDARPAWVVVQTVNPEAETPPVEQFAERFDWAYAQAVRRGICKPYPEEVVS